MKDGSQASNYTSLRILIALLHSFQGMELSPNRDDDPEDKEAHTARRYLSSSSPVLPPLTAISPHSRPIAGAVGAYPHPLSTVESNSRASRLMRCGPENDQWGYSHNASVSLQPPPYPLPSVSRRDFSTSYPRLNAVYEQQASSVSSSFNLLPDHLASYAVATEAPLAHASLSNNCVTEPTSFRSPISNSSMVSSPSTDNHFSSSPTLAGDTLSRSMPAGRLASGAYYPAHDHRSLQSHLPPRSFPPTPFLGSRHSAHGRPALHSSWDSDVRCHQVNPSQNPYTGRSDDAALYQSYYAHHHLHPTTDSPPLGMSKNAILSRSVGGQPLSYSTSHVGVRSESYSSQGISTHAESQPAPPRAPKAYGQPTLHQESSAVSSEEAEREPGGETGAENNMETAGLNIAALVRLPRTKNLSPFAPFARIPHSPKTLKRPLTAAERNENRSIKRAREKIAEESQLAREASYFSILSHADSLPLSEVMASLESGEFPIDHQFFPDGNSAIFFAVSNEMVDALILRGANLEIRNKDNRTPLCHLLLLGRLKVAIHLAECMVQRNISLHCPGLRLPWFKPTQSMRRQRRMRLMSPIAAMMQSSSKLPCLSTESYRIGEDRKLLKELPAPSMEELVRDSEYVRDTFTMFIKLLVYGATASENLGWKRNPSEGANGEKYSYHPLEKLTSKLLSGDTTMFSSCQFAPFRGPILRILAQAGGNLLYQFKAEQSHSQTLLPRLLLQLLSVEEEVMLPCCPASEHWMRGNVSSGQYASTTQGSDAGGMQTSTFIIKQHTERKKFVRARHIAAKQVAFRAQILACVECLGGIGDFPGIEEEVIHGFGTRVMPTVLCRLLVSARRAREIYKHFNFPLAARRSLVIGTWKQYDPLARGRRYAGDGSPPIRHWTCYFDENTTIWPGDTWEDQVLLPMRVVDRIMEWADHTPLARKREYDGARHKCKSEEGEHLDSFAQTSVLEKNDTLTETNDEFEDYSLPLANNGEAMFFLHRFLEHCGLELVEEFHGHKGCYLMFGGEWAKFIFDFSRLNIRHPFGQVVTFPSLKGLAGENLGLAEQS